MSQQHVIVVGAGIAGISSAIWLRREGFDVTVIDRAAPGQGTSFGNGGILASCSVVPVTGPKLVRKAPGFLLDPNYPLFLRYSYLPRLLPWLFKYLSHANDADTRWIAGGLKEIVADSVEAHEALVKGTSAADWITHSDYCFAYKDRSGFDGDAYGLSLRREAGFVPELIEGGAVRDYEPLFGPEVGLIAAFKDHGYVRDPGGYVAALAQVLTEEGGQIKQAELKDIALSDGKIVALITDQGRMECDRAVLATGVWSKPLAKKLGLNVPLETERGYHIVFENPSEQLRNCYMVAAGKFVATPMAAGMRCAGIVEFGGLDAGPSKAPLDFLRRKVKEVFPDLRWSGEQEWLGHRPAPSDSLPLIGEIGASGVFTNFGHHHIGLTSGPKTGRLLAEMMAEKRSNRDLSVFDPMRFE